MKLNITTKTSRTMAVVLPLCGLLGASACATTGPSKEEQQLLDAPSPTQRANEKVILAMQSPLRSPENKARDKARHPSQTLAFLGLQDNFTVLELFPGGGWYTEILAPVLRDNGKLIISSADTNGDPESYEVKGAKKMDAFLASHPEAFDKVGKVIVDGKAPNFGADNSVDMVLVFRSLHGWVGAGTADKVLVSIFKVLKPGGTFGIEGHRGKPGTEPAGGYVPEETAINLIKSAGFELAEKSEINANPKDTKDYPKGVWTLPPNFAEGDTDHDKYAKIGESDRFTLRFVKPVK
jgi:predicted methyltransferase